MFGSVFFFFFFFPCCNQRIKVNSFTVLKAEMLKIG